MTKGPTVTELKVYLSEELDKKFRLMAMSVYGYGRGSLSKAAEEAFTRWCTEHENSSTSTETSPVSKRTEKDMKAPVQTGIDPDERRKAEHPENKFEEKDPVGTAGTNA